jgi:hypothetical protein
MKKPAEQYSTEVLLENKSEIIEEAESLKESDFSDSQED